MIVRQNCRYHIGVLRIYDRNEQHSLGHELPPCEAVPHKPQAKFCDEILLPRQAINNHLFLLALPRC